MGKNINIMDVNIDICTAKEAMRLAIECMESEKLSIFELLTSNILLHLDAMPELKKELSEFELLIAGETTLLKAAGIADKKLIQEIENRVFLKMFMRYLKKNHKRVYLLAETKDENKEFQEYMNQFYCGIEIAGALSVTDEQKTDEQRTDDMIVNAINGSEVDCVLSILSSPLQEQFVVRNRNLLNTRVWLSLGREIIPVCKKKMKHNRLMQFVIRRILQKEIEKQKKNGGN